jgi:hypothetical protein
MGELPGGAVLAAAQAAANHVQVASDVGGGKIELGQSFASQRQQFAQEQLGGRHFAASVEPHHLRVETVTRGTVEIVARDGETAVVIQELPAWPAAYAP